MNTETPSPAEGGPGPEDAAGAPGSPWQPPPDRSYETGYLPVATDAESQPVQPRPADRPRPSLRNRLLVSGAVVAVTGLIGFPLGWLWSTLAPWLPIRVIGGGAYYVDPEPEQPAAAEGWFILLSFGTGIIFALLAWFLLRRYRGPLMIGALAIGSIITGWLTWRFGHTIGRGAVLAKARVAKDGTVLTFPPDLRIRSGGATGEGIGHWHGIPYIGGVLLFAAVAAIVVYLLLTVFSLSPSLGLRRHAEAAADAEYDRLRGAA